MPDLSPTIDRDRLALRSAGALADVLAELDGIESQLAAVPDWRPAAALTAELAWAREQIERMAAAWGNKLVVALVGPSGAGKSTLLNALAGRTISPTGLQRPTTRDIVAYVADEDDVAGLRPQWGATPVQVQVEPGAPSLAHLVLVDAPDTNTTPEGLAALGRVLETVDIVVAVFAAHNPRLHDNIAFLAPFVRQLPAASVVPVINMVDRAPLDELRETVLPDLQAALRREWGLSPAHIYLVSGLSSLDSASFAADEQPLHDINEFDALRALLFESLNRATQVVDRRLAHARRLVQLVQDDLAAAIDGHAEALQEAHALLDSFDRQLARVMGDRLAQRSGQVRGLDLHAALYGRLAARWWGPIGWVLAVWGLLVRATAWIAHLGRRSAGGELALDLSGLDEALAERYAHDWPPVADALARGGFAGVRQSQQVSTQIAQAQAALTERAPRAVVQSLDDSAGRLAHPLLQILLNGPVLALLGWIGYRAVASFLAGAYLPQGYLQNAGVALLAVWAACFVLLQVIVSLAVRGGVRRRLGRALAAALAQPGQQAYAVQVDALLGR